MRKGGGKRQACLFWRPILTTASVALLPPCLDLTPERPGRIGTPKMNSVAPRDASFTDSRQIPSPSPLVKFRARNLTRIGKTCIARRDGADS